ncbi:MAG: hypothetical protein WCF36_05365 [Candidatus Nanopelagicales bacterium]
MNAAPSQVRSLSRVVEHDEHLIAMYPPLAVSIYSAVTTGQPFDQHRDHLLAVLAEGLVTHDEFDRAVQDAGQDDDAVGMLTAAMAAQHRSLAARVDELARATTGLDAVAITRTIHAILNLTLDLGRRILHHHGPKPASSGSDAEPLPG